MEQWILICHRLAENVRSLNQQLQKQDQKLNRTKSLWSSEMRQSQSQFDKHVELKDTEIAMFKRMLKDNEKSYEEKLASLKDRLKDTEKKIHLQVEGEYSALLQQKDQMIEEQAEQFDSIQKLIREMGERVEKERESI